MDDHYFSVSKPAEAETKIRGSRFIGRVEKVATLEDTIDFLERIRKKEYSATHNCYAYRVGVTDKQQFKYSDDGEPSGTAGKPIFDLIEGRSLTNSMIVVTRYYGGTKLGTGGLARAYAEAAALALEKAGVKENFLTDRLRVRIEMGLYNQLMQLLERFMILERNAEFSDSATVELTVRTSQTDLLIREIVDLSSGRAEVEKDD